MNNTGSMTNMALKLDVQQAWWSMAGAGDDHGEWSVERKFDEIAKAGFTGIFGGIPAEGTERDQFRKLLDDYDFSFGTGGFPSTAEELAGQLAEAKEFGAQYVNSQVMDSFVVDDEALALLRQLEEVSNAAGVPHFVETHRGRITQDLIRTASYVQKLPGLALTIDFSHYVLAGEMDGFASQVEAKAEPYFDTLLRRTACIHGRICHGQQIQAQIGTDTADHLTARFHRWWQRGMTYWKEKADSDTVFPFVCELGPDPYAAGVSGQERFKQSILLKNQVVQLWEQS
ncbi:sugar phosphate isomerase/epimerase family protein [Paenibacillus lemnae]|uniref:Sugar phosphate isomerase/epimerase n=1 Tax=Paenibacillus lemnae TaxID=1330551 RepID=A0A848M3R8_PAELE|nr:TIM barrel protein [Paenibacillus lemnae]NMO94899.1 sugar phosphate isomerase/epimerase [Paenibacillus lemnae]